MATGRSFATVFSITRAISLLLASLSACHASLHTFVPNDRLAVPSIAIVGTSKGGTTDLHYQIVDLFPNVISPQQKEPANLVIGNHANLWKTHTEMGFRNYLVKLNHPCNRYALNEEFPSFEQCAMHHDNITIDSTPYYMDYSRVATLLKAYSPNTKIVMMLRDPVIRCESLYNHYKSGDGLRNKHNLTVEELARAFMQWTRKPNIKELIDKMLASEDPNEVHATYEQLIGEGMFERPGNFIFGSGLYYYSLAFWKNTLLQQDRFVLMDSNYYFQDRVAMLDSVKQFLFGQALSDSERAKSESMNVRNAKRLDGHWVLPGSAFSEEMKKMLYDFYRPHTRRLLQLIQEMRNSGFWVIGFDTEFWQAQA